MPDLISNCLIDILNPLRKKFIKKFIHPKWITLFITNYCSAKCEHCFYSNELNNKIENLNLENLKIIFSSLYKKLNTLRITGGEPFLNKDLAEFIIFLDQKKITQKIAITSHGMIANLNKKIEYILKNVKYTQLHIGISIDGLKDTHEDFRKIKNGFDLLIKNLDFFEIYKNKYSNFSFSTTTTLIKEICFNKNNKDSELNKLLTFLTSKYSLNNNIGFDHVRDSNRDSFNLNENIKSNFKIPEINKKNNFKHHVRTREIEMSLDEKYIVNSFLKTNYLSNDLLTSERLKIETDILKTKSRIVDCLAGYVDCVIYPSLDVAVCETTRPFANLKKYNLNLIELLQSKQASDMRSQTSSCACTHPCHLSDSMAYDGNFLKKYFKKYNEK